jgi:glycine/D-amino acid oxidase-like deaminating enzyme
VPGHRLGRRYADERSRDPQPRRGAAASLFDTVDEIGRVCATEGIDAHFDRGGSLRIATAAFHAGAQRRELEQRYRLGFTESDYRWLEPAAAAARLRITPNHGAVLFAHCAAVQPARLVLGLAAAARRLGVRIYEHTAVTRIEARQVQTARGTVRAERVVRATEAYTASLPGHRRDMLPVYSMMVATAPLPDALWSSIGLRHRETFGDDRRVVLYGQRTRDGRLALGGRAGYEFGSGRRRVVSADHPMVLRVARLLRELLPQLADVPITHGWGGVLGIPRHWRPCVHFDRRTGLGWAGGYVGEGVAASNLAARCLVDLMLERPSPLADLPWVGDVPPRWEPEPLRWLGARARNSPPSAPTAWNSHATAHHACGDACSTRWCAESAGALKALVR